MNKIHMSLLCGVTLLVVASSAFAADKMEKKSEGSAMTSGAKPDMHHRGRPFVLRGNQGFHYGDHLNPYTMKSRGTEKSKGYLETK